MSGRLPLEHRLRRADRTYLEEIVRDGQLIQRVANRARALLAFDHGETPAVVSYWTGLGRSALWYLWRRYEERGVEAIVDAERCGAPPILSPPPASPDRADRVHRARSLRPSPYTLGLPEPLGGRRRGGCRRLDPLHDSRARAQGREPPAAPESLLEDGHH